MSTLKRLLRISVWLLTFGALSFSLPALAQTPIPSAKDMNAGIIYGDHFSYVLIAPKGWVLDNQSGVEQGLDAVFYPQDSTWQDTKVFMYANTTVKGKKDTLDSFIKNDVVNYRDNRKTKDIQDAPPLAIANGNRVPVKYFLGDMNGNYEACAYVDQKSAVAFLVLTAVDESLFRRSLPAFVQLVSSYGFLTDNVQMGSEAPVSMSYGIPPDILAKAKKETDAPEGQKYDGAMGSVLQSGVGKELQDCVSGAANRGDYKIVLIVDKDGTVTGLYGEKHNPGYDCLVPKLSDTKLPEPPYAPFYYLFELVVGK